MRIAEHLDQNGERHFIASQEIKTQPGLECNGGGPPHGVAKKTSIRRE